MLESAMAFDPDRRRFLNNWAMGAAAALMATPWRGSARAQTPRFHADPFSLGVASGDPLSDGFVAWTRLAPEPLDPDFALDGLIEVGVEVASDEAFRQIVRRDVAVARPDNAHAVHAEIQGLEPGRQYFYRFQCAGVTSPVGRAKTAPLYGSPLSQLRFAWHSCAHYEQGFFNAYRDIAAQDPDVILSLGDYIYEVSYGPSVRRMPVDDASSLSDYRLIHAANKLDKDLQAAHACAPWLFIWDDHEVANDYQGDVGKVLPGQTQDQFRARRLAAYKAFFEHVPLRTRSRFDAAMQMRIYGECAFGDLVDFTLLDTRQYRSPAACPVDGRYEGNFVERNACQQLRDPSRTILGARQERFVREQFARAPFRWSVLVQPTLFGALNQKNDRGEAVAFTDGWNGFEPARQQLINLMRQRRRDSQPVVIGGDMHGFWAADVKMDYADPASETVAFEFVGGSVTSKSYNFDRFTRMLPDNPHIRFFDDRTNGYGLVDVTRDRMNVKLRHTQSTWRRDAAFSNLKSYVIERGNPSASEVST
jgi:alkaline phosphatase D